MTSLKCFEPKTVSDLRILYLYHQKTADVLANSILFVDISVAIMLIISIPFPWAVLYCVSAMMIKFCFGLENRRSANEVAAMAYFRHFTDLEMAEMKNQLLAIKIIHKQIKATNRLYWEEEYNEKRLKWATKWVEGENGTT